MLPSELLVIIRWRNSVRPKYSKMEEREVSAAEAVIKIYAKGVGLKRGELRERVAELEDTYGSFKFIRGLAALIERKCIFSSKAAVDPVEARHALFAEASTRGFPTSEEERRVILETVAAKFNVSPERLEASIYADLDSEMVLEQAPEVKPIQLLKEYNLSLTQTLLFHAAEITFTASGNWQRIFRAVKYYGLMYAAMKWNGKFTVRLDGPTSLFKLTRRYGAAFAKVLPEIFAGKPWWIEAKILREGKLLNFTIESGKHGWLFPETCMEETYDSSVEAEFASEFKTLATEWALRREAEPIEVGSSIMIPDFVFQFGGTHVLMEIIGFWTRNYLRRKLEKLSAVRDTPFIAAVNEDLACDKVARFKASNPNIHVIYYKEKIPVKEVLKILKSYAESEVKAQTAELRLDIKKPVETLKELAERHGVMVEAIRQVAENLETHVIIGEALIEKTLIQEIREALEKAVTTETPLPKVLEVLKSYKLPDPIAVIIHCGFKIKWHGLLMENAIVYKNSTRKPTVFNLG